jgi:hypothetical protein
MTPKFGKEPVGLATESKVSTAVATRIEVRLLRVFCSAVLMLLAANCFLKYLWWTACYSAWSGIPKLYDQWQAAGTRASFNGWTVIVLEAASIVVLCTAIRLRYAVRVLASFAITLAGTAFLALLLSWIKQGIR